MLREHLQPPGDHVMNFGKYRTWMYSEVPEDYMRWAIQEVKVNANASPDLREFANWAQAELQQRGQRAKKHGRVPPSEDPEVNAVTEPPTLSVKSWGTSAASSVHTPTPKTKRSAASLQQMEMSKNMSPDISEEDKREFAELQTRLAVLMQKNQVAPGTPNGLEGNQGE